MMLKDDNSREPFLVKKQSILHFVGAVIALLTFVGPLYMFFWAMHVVCCLWKKEDPGVIDLAELTRNSELIGSVVLIGIAMCIPFYLTIKVLQMLES